MFLVAERSGKSFQTGCVFYGPPGICVYICVFYRTDLENGWMDFHNFFLYEHYGSRRTHGLHGLSKNGLETTEKLENMLKNCRFSL